jgi:hypothetical protein
LAAAIDDRGNALVAWASGTPFSNSGDPNRLMAARRRAGGGFEPPVAIVEGSRQVGNPAAAVDAAGRFVVTWSSARTRKTGGGFQTLPDRTSAVRAGAAGPWSRPVPVSNGGSDVMGFQSYGPLAENGAGGITGVWPSRQGIVARDLPPGGTFGPAQPIITGASRFSYMGSFAQLAAVPAGGAVYVATRLGTRRPYVVAFVREPYGPTSTGGQ